MEFEKLFIESKGQPIIYKSKELKMIDKISLSSNKLILDIEFVSTNSKWKQGIVLKTNGDFHVNGQKVPQKIVLWEHTAPKKNTIQLNSKDKLLSVYNVWETEDGTVHFWHSAAAFFIEKSNESKIYYCNDGYPDEDFDDLIFKIDF